MFKHHLLLFFRNAKKYKTSFLINIIGLSSALTCVLIIYSWVYYETHIDKFHAQDERLYQIMQNEQTPNGIDTYENTPGLLAQSLEEEFPEVVLTAATVPYEWFEGETFVLSDGEGTYFESRNQFSSSAYFKLFSYPLLSGDAESVLARKDAVVISETLAKKLYNTTDVIGEPLEWIHEDFGNTYTVSGVFKDIPQNSSSQFDAVFHYDVFLDDNENMLGWSDSDPSTYILLAQNANIDQLNPKLSSYLKSKNEHIKHTLFAQQYSTRYLHGNYTDGAPSGGKIIYIQLFSIIALFILVIACINFMNLSTAQATTRLKEIGIKKALGIVRIKLAQQYITETFFTLFIALCVALFLLQFALPVFGKILGQPIPFVSNYKVFLSIFGIAIGTALLAGSYPALYLSGFGPIKALKGLLTHSAGDRIARKGLVIFQFAISTILISAILIINTQIQHIQSKDLGYDKENVIWF